MLLPNLVLRSLMSTLIPIRAPLLLNDTTRSVLALHEPLHHADTSGTSFLFLTLFALLNPALLSEDASEFDELELEAPAPKKRKGDTISTVRQVPVSVLPSYARPVPAHPDEMRIFIQPPTPSAEPPLFPRLLKISAYCPSAGVSLVPPIKIVFD